MSKPPAPYHLTGKIIPPGWAKIKGEDKEDGSRMSGTLLTFEHFGLETVCGAGRRSDEKIAPFVSYDCHLGYPKAEKKFS